MGQQYILATFDDEHDLVEVSHELKNQQIVIEDFYTPFPVHGLDGFLGITRTRLPYVTFVAGATGLVFAMLFQIWSSAVDWPINVGGKPMMSIPAFVPITFELMVLFGALTTVAAFFYISKMYPTKTPKILHPRQLDDKFLVLVKVENNREKIEEIVKGHTKEWKVLGQEQL